jgi:hypothetical protein
MSDLLSKDEIKQYMDLLDSLPADSPQIEKVWALLKAHKRAVCRESFLPFVKEMWPSFIGGRHHKIMADAFERVANGDLKRLIINMPPRHTKSEFASYLFPAWYLGRFPEKKIIQTAHTAELAVGFGRKVRNLVGSSDYQGIFPTKLSADSKAAGRWNTHKGGDYFAIGVGGAVTGKGADVLIIDDPHSEQEAMQGNPGVYDRVYEWYSSGPRQRLQPGGSIVVVMTRWSKRDLTGQVIANSVAREGDEWIRAEIPVGKWEAQYQQNPTSEEGAIIKRDMWKIWEDEEPPRCEYIIQSWDTAFEKNNRADYSACTTWGVFYKTNEEGFDYANLVLLDAFKDRMEFPELKKTAYEMYRQWQPDTLIVEKKAAGAPLIYEMRKMGIPMSEYTPSKGSDKICIRACVVSKQTLGGRSYGGIGLLSER